MPLVKAQSVLKELLPLKCFRLLYNSVLCAYKMMRWILDEVYYPCLFIYYFLKGDAPKAKRMRVIRTIRPYTMVGRSGLLATYDLASEIERNNIGGCFVECGVARGGCSALMAMVATGDRKVWAFDSFEGLPQPGENDELFPLIEYKPKGRKSSYLSQGYCLGTYEEVNDLLFTKLGFSRDNVFIVKGWFEDTLCAGEIGDIAILRIDADWYEATKFCLETLYGNVVSGGYVIIDDYGSVGGCRKATDEFIGKRKLDVKLNFDKRGGVHFACPSI